MWLSLAASGIVAVVAVFVPFCIMQMLAGPVPNRHGEAAYFAPVGWFLILLVFAYFVALTITTLAARGRAPRHSVGRMVICGLMLGFAMMLLISRSKLPAHTSQGQLIGNLLAGRDLGAPAIVFVAAMLFSDSEFRQTWPRYPSGRSLAAIWDEVLDGWVSGHVAVETDHQGARLRDLDSLFAILSEIPDSAARRWMIEKRRWIQIQEGNPGVLLDEARWFVQAWHPRTPVAARVRRAIFRTHVAHPSQQR
jgi:hypothetical protein